ncbi:hypothetical protein [Mycobacterium sp. NAZ190054]|uniref:hypothetical protein n=1 Tax=Mycobacterium sp. NAZ190054 TaxID=1747766 RepID=UPI0012E37E8C|nr:hypothetical protein [Mycobacterium sp. NAZ190054]
MKGLHSSNGRYGATAATALTNRNLHGLETARSLDPRVCRRVHPAPALTVSQVVPVGGNSADTTSNAARRRLPDIEVVPRESVGKGDVLTAGSQVHSGERVEVIA